MRESTNIRLHNNAAEIVGLRTGEARGRNAPKVISEDELKDIMNSLEDGTVLSVRFMEGGDGDE